jgi:hypothetical protein
VGPATIVGAGADVAFQAKFRPGGAKDVRFVDLDVSGFTQGIWCWVGTQVIGGRYHHNSRNGIGCGLEGGGGVLVDGVEIDHNGSVDYLYSDAGGMKFAQGHGIVVRNSRVHDNVGIGVWCDVQCGDYTVVDNVITGNSRKGVHYEKSGASDLNGIVYEGMAIIARNVIQDNGYGTQESTNAGVIAVSSKNMLIEDNVFGGNALSNGIKIRQDSRLTGDTHGWVISNVTIRRNTMNGDDIDGCDIDDVRCS